MITEKFTQNKEFNSKSPKELIKKAAKIGFTAALWPIPYILKKRNEKHKWLDDKNSKKLESNKERRNDKQKEQLATKKFNEIYDRINKISKWDVYRYNDGNTTIDISITEDEVQQIIFIDKQESEQTTTYELKRTKTWNYQLHGIENNKRNTIDDLTSDELLDDILPLIENRIEEAENHQKQERINKIKKANLLAQAQDQKDADDLLKWLDNSSSLA